MRQVIQNLRTGKLNIDNVPCSRPRPHHVLVRTTSTLLSSGTERTLIQFARAGYLEKARQQPDKLRLILDKIRTDGLLPTLESVNAKLDQPFPLGYCNVGRVLEVGARVNEFRPGQRVVSNGFHAEMVQVPRNLCAAIPDVVSDEAAAFAVLGAIGLQGLRLAAPTIGEYFAVTGMGLIGLLAAQLLRAHGCNVLGIDVNGDRLELARQFGIETVDLQKGQDPVAFVRAWTRGNGVDGVLLTASTRSSEPVRQATEMCRKRGRIVLIGVTGLELSREEFYKKELSFQVSCSYGPGRYDKRYEENGEDYPYAFVRWTAQRNFDAVLRLMASGALKTEALVSHRFKIDNAAEAYHLIESSQPSLGVLLRYPGDEEVSDEELRTPTIQLVSSGKERSGPVVSFIGSGVFASKVLMPAFKKAGVCWGKVASNGGLTAATCARRFGFSAATTDVDALLSDPEVDTIVIATHHDSHADYAVRALSAGKHVYCEKPLALNESELDQIRTAYEQACNRQNAPRLMVGFNRRFSPHAIRIRSLLTELTEPKAILMTVNAGVIAPEHWTRDRRIGGGRIVGEACHFIDLLRFIVGSRITSAHATRLGAALPDDTVSFTLRFECGSIGTVHYFCNGNRAVPKERLEIFCGGRTLLLNNFRKLTGHGWKRFQKLNLWTQDKGNKSAVASFVQAIRDGAPSPIPFDELMEVSRCAIQLSNEI